LDEDGDVRNCPYPIEALLIHRAPMLLLDDVVGYGDDCLQASVIITPSSLFAGSHGVPGHVAIEYMAQACGAFAGAIALDRGMPVKIGFLLGTRMCKVMVPWFRIGERLLVSASLVFHDEQMAVFDCKIEVDGQLAAEAQLKVYQPDDDLSRLDEVE
jgi:predicted hotdog family 3-hydroxylacyl-ACP dehydratase